MALLTAGKQISVGGNQAFGRGLFVVDPDVAEREANKKLAYKEELRLQMEEKMRKKKQQKRKEEEEDIRLQKKFYEELKKDTQKKTDRPVPKNDKNIPPPNQKSQMIRSELFREEPQQRREEPQQRREEVDFKFSLRANTTEDDYSRPQGGNPYLQRAPNLYEMQEEQFFDETNTLKIRAMREALQEKMNEVYRKIHQSKDLEVDKELELIRRKINNSNVSYESDNPKEKEFQNEFSHFYKIPKKMTHEEHPLKDLNYNSRTEFKRTDYALPQRNQQYAPEERGGTSRNKQSRESMGSNNDGWGRKKGKNNFLGNREAADFQIESISNNIDTILNQYQK